MVQRERTSLLNVITPLCPYADVIFLEHPENETITRGSTATFSCEIVNSSFSLLWLFNGTDSVFQDHDGVSAMLINGTVSKLMVIGYAKNNNTPVICVAARFYPDLVWFESRTASLIVLGECKILC